MPDVYAYAALALLYLVIGLGIIAATVRVLGQPPERLRDRTYGFVLLFWPAFVLTVAWFVLIGAVGWLMTRVER